MADDATATSTSTAQSDVSTCSLPALQQRIDSLLAAYNANDTDLIPASLMSTVDKTLSLLPDRMKTLEADLEEQERLGLGSELSAEGKKRYGIMLGLTKLPR